MKFKEAFDKVLDEIFLEIGGQDFARQDAMQRSAVTPREARLLAIIWNMLAVSQKKLDDLVYIDKNTDILSTPINEKSKEDKNSTEDNKKANNKKAVKSVEDGKEKEETNTKQSATS